jgi:hypothetical protein
MCPDATELNVFAMPDVDVKDGDIVIIEGAGEFVEIEDRTTKKIVRKLRIPLKCADGQVKELTLNTTSNNALIKGYGKNSEDWVGKQAVAAVVTKDVFGQMKRLIYLAPAK